MDVDSSLRQKAKGCVLGPLPPPVGGIASIVALLHEGLAHRDDLVFAQPVLKQERAFAAAIRPFQQLWLLSLLILRVERGGRILMFSSAHASFFEKLAWATLISVAGRSAVLVMVDGNFPKFWNSLPSWLRYAISFVVRRFQFRIAAQSQQWAKFYRTAFPSSAVSVIDATVDADFFNNIGLRKAKPDNSKLSLLYVGWIVDEKGIRDLLDAVTIVHRTHRQFELRLIGPLFGREHFWQQEIEARELSDCVQLIGAVTNRSVLLREYSAADIFVFPSHAEGFPVAMLEAIAQGLPCVGTTVGGIPDILNHGDSGVLVPPHEPEALARAIIDLLDDSAKRTSLSAKAAERAKIIYSHEACLASYLKAIGLEAE